MELSLQCSGQEIIKTCNCKVWDEFYYLFEWTDVSMSTHLSKYYPSNPNVLKFGTRSFQSYKQLVRIGKFLDILAERVISHGLLYTTCMQYNI